MISHLSIKDFAIIKDLDLDLNPGLNIITGETGAGKSIIIEAISMALGARADADYIRHGQTKASITLCIDDADGNDYVIKREISSQGKNLIKINGEISTLSELNALCRSLADIHGQYDNQSLLNPDNHTDVLDLYGGEELQKVKAITAESYHNYAEISAQLKALKKKIEDSKREKDLLAYELREITEASLLPNEDETLAEEIKIMENSESIFESLSMVMDALFNSDYCALDGLGKAMNEMDSISSFSEDLESMSSSISDAYYAIEELNSEIRSYKESINFDQDELNQKIERAEYIEKLKRKYGKTLEDVFAYREKAAKALLVMENADEEIAELESKLSYAKEAFITASSRLNILREETAKRIEKEVTKELLELNFTNALFTAKLSPCPACEKGTTSAEFLITTNKGEDPKPLVKIASGGEVSRIMLALKKITGDLDRIPTMVFDEIDTGISGMTAGIVGQKLKEIANTHQVICITHLPQIAALGDYHYKIQKFDDEESSYTTVLPLDKEGATLELARLLSGTEITEEALAQAKKLIQ